MIPKKAFIMVDVQKDFFTGGSLAVAGAEGVVDNLNSIAQAFFMAQQPVFGCRDWHTADHKSFKVNGGVYPVHCIQGSVGAEIHPDLIQKGVTIVDKAYDVDDQNMSAFADGRLKAMLEVSGCKVVYLGGLTTEFGIKATALDALKIGLAVFIVTEAIVPAKPLNGDQAIVDMVKAGAQFISIAEALTHLPALVV